MKSANVADFIVEFRVMYENFLKRRRLNRADVIACIFLQEVVSLLKLFQRMGCRSTTISQAKMLRWTINIKFRSVVHMAKKIMKKVKGHPKSEKLIRDVLKAIKEVVDS